MRHAAVLRESRRPGPFPGRAASPFPVFLANPREKAGLADNRRVLYIFTARVTRMTVSPTIDRLLLAKMSETNFRSCAFLGPGTIYGPKAQKIVLIVIDELKDAIHVHASVGSGSRSPLWCQTDPSGVKLNLQSGLCDENVSSD